MAEVCPVCKKVVYGHRIKEYRGKKYCFNCFEIKSLVDGLMLDFKINTVELMILAGEVDSFCRGFLSVN